MKKFIVTTLILTLALFIFTLSSFGGGAYVERNEAPNDDFEYIQDLVFDFGDDFVLELPDGTELEVKCVAVVAPGKEIIVITPSDRYNYDAKLEAGTNYATSPNADLECSELNSLIETPDALEALADLVIIFESASLNEHYIEEEPGVVPDIVNLFFKVKDAMFIGQDGYPIEPPFNLMLKLKNSVPQIIKFKF